MSPGSSTESYPAFAHIGLRENPGKNLNQVTCPDRESNPGHLVSRPDALTVTPQVWTTSLSYQSIVLWSEQGSEISYKGRGKNKFTVSKETVSRVPEEYREEGSTFEAARQDKQTSEEVAVFRMQRC
ncbi:hypothetical protein ANN_22219 [Periplaneta americana]|uniref:Uncharacterized protein n=1 Tax=Periplaneta americana TaxID=6978 RepID=A0ABQ8S8A2_PERAM|nr:hypothetical protein ANN_22219 [Periplaneta americana]